MILQPTEGQLHASVAELLDVLLLSPAFFTTFPAGGYGLSKALGGIMKRRGLKAGMPDILVFYDGRCIGIELKVGKNKLSAAQVMTIDKLERAGIKVYVCRTIDQIVSLLVKEKFPLRGHTHENVPGVRDLTRYSILGA